MVVSLQPSDVDAVSVAVEAVATVAAPSTLVTEEDIKRAGDWKLTQTNDYFQKKGSP